MDAADFFWNIVACKRSLALGGNSQEEYFHLWMILEVMWKIEKALNHVIHIIHAETYGRFIPDDRKELYTSIFMKRRYTITILSTQHPKHGGYVYFTSARPAHYRVYSKPNSAMWCCVGTGMENHGKYGEFIYTHSSDSLFVNLFISSRLNWGQEKVTITQETNFPDEETSRLTVKLKSGESCHFKLLLRRPA